MRNLLGRGSAPLQTVVAIVTTAIVFSVLHVPTIVLVEGTPIGQAVGSLILLTLSGITFGVMYALTRNLFLVALLHGLGNLWPLVVDPGIGAWPNWGVVIVLYGLVVVLYRQWGTIPFRATTSVDTGV